MRTTLVYDGSFEGFLSAVFQVYEEKIAAVTIQKKELALRSIFDKQYTVITDQKKAKRVWKGIAHTCSSEGKNNIYKAFLSELPKIEDTLLYFIRRSFTEIKKIDKDFADPKILKISKVVKMVNREKHRMDAFVRFKLTKDNLYFATVSPDFNVLPLNARHFKKRYADQKWLLYDVTRKYGLYYDLREVSAVKITLSEEISKDSKTLDYFSEEEHAFQELWRNYYKSTNIASRKNMKLHLQHVPKRYWKYLSEKATDLKN